MHCVFTNSSSTDSGPDMSRAGMKAIKWDLKKSLASWSRGHLRIHTIFCACQLPPWLSNWGDASGNSYSSGLLLTPFSMLRWGPKSCSILAKNQEPFYCPLCKENMHCRFLGREALYTKDSRDRTMAGAPWLTIISPRAQINQTWKVMACDALASQNAPV